MLNLDEIIDEFAELDREGKLEALLEFSEELPPLPEELKELRDAGLNRIQECQTPVYMWVDVKDDKVFIHADVAPEAPTVRGFVSILVQAFHGAPATQVADAPNDLLHRIGIAQILGMMRMQGLTWVLQRIKGEVKQKAGLA